MLLALCAPAVAPAADTAPADENNESIWTRDKLTGDDWYGARSGLSEHGIDLDLRLTQYGQRVTSGGVNQKGENGGTMDYRLNIDGDKLFGAKGFAVNMHARTRWGKDTSADAGAFTLQNTGMLTPAPGGYEHTDITGLTVSQYLPIFGLSIVEVGKLDVPDLLTLFFPNVGYGQEGFWNVNSMVSAMPWIGAVQGLSLYGGIGATINQEHEIIQSGIILTGTENVATRPVGKGSMGGGTWIAGFHRFLWTTDDDGHQGYFMIFAAGSTNEQASNDPHDWVFVHGQGIESEDEENPWDVALYLYQDFWQAKGDPKRKANFMVGGTAGPDNPQMVQYNLFANVEVFGLMDSRPRDRMGAAVFWNGLSDEYEELVSPVVDLEDAYGFEVYYNVEVTKWLHMGPDLQVVDTELADEDTAVIIGARLTADF